MNFINALTPWGWVVLAVIPPLIILLYFLKLKRQPVEVPSTYLWHRAIEDLHVNAIWQRLRKNWLLLLQLLLLALIIAACLRPGWRGVQLTGDRFIFLIDNSASMNATDGDGDQTRLEAAKERCSELIDQMKDTDWAMIISFSDRYDTVQSYTHSRAELRRKLDDIQSTNRPTDLSLALRAAAGLANPGRTSQDVNDVPVADAVPATLYVFTDGGFLSPTDFSLGNLTPKYVSLGDQGRARNIGIVSFSVANNPDTPTRIQAYARVENFDDEAADAVVALYLNDVFRDFQPVTIPPVGESGAGSAGVQFQINAANIEDLQGDILTIQLKDKSEFDGGGAGSGDAVLALDAAMFEDHFQLDNTAHAVINMPRQANVLLVTPRNDALELALATSQAQKLAASTVARPDYLETKEYVTKSEAGEYDLVIFDQCAPEKMPQANTLFIGALPPVAGWSLGEDEGPPVILDVDDDSAEGHPLVQLMSEIRTIWIVEGRGVTGPEGSNSLIDSTVGPLLTIAPREGFEDAVLGFALISMNDEGQYEVNTDWPRRYSFPVFVRNVLTYLGGSRGLFAAPNIQPGQSHTLRTTTPVEQLLVTPPAGDDIPVPRTQNVYLFGDTEIPGVYEVRQDEDQPVTQRFAVNLFDSQESNILPRDFSIGHQEIQATEAWEPKRFELWKWLLGLGLVVLLVEWYVFNRRIHL